MSAPDKSIDRARVGISKSLMTSPCERKGAYGEWVRDQDGRRLDFPMPERVTFGSAVDEAVTFILYHELHDSRYARQDAVAAGMRAAMGKSGWGLVPDVAAFRSELEHAVSNYFIEPDGFARIEALRGENVRLQGDDGESLRAEPDLIGTPDVLTDRRVVDVKTASRRYGPEKFRQSAEMPVYALLFTAHFGYLPDSLAYQVWVRTQRPYWQWIEVAASTLHVELARLHADRWRRGLATNDISLFAFNAAFCADCPFALPIPEVSFGGCPVGLLVNEDKESAA